MYKGKIPFDSEGDLLSYVYPSQINVDWKDNFEFEGVLKFLDYGRGRSSAFFILLVCRVNEKEYVWLEGKKVIMRLSQLNDYIQKKGTIVDTIMFGKWTFYKQGQNYSVGLATKS